MQQTTPETFPDAASDMPWRPRVGIRALRRIGLGLDYLGRLTEAGLKVIGEAYLEGIVAYGAAMHGVIPTDVGIRTAPSRGVPIRRNPEADMEEAAFQDVDTLYAWLDLQMDPNQRK